MVEQASLDKEGEVASGKRLRRNWIQTYAPTTDASIQVLTDAQCSQVSLVKLQFELCNPHTLMADFS